MPGPNESMDAYCKRMMDDPAMMKKYPDDKARLKALCGQWQQGQDKQMTAEYEKLAQERKTYDISDVEIFSAGSWNGDEYSVDDLDEMVKAFNEIGGEVKPYLKLGHNKDQKLLQKDGMPAAGWVTGLKRVGEKLLANFTAIPEKIYELINAKAYGRMSSEIYWNLKDGDKKYKRVLKAVALLGADTPAVQTLDDFINLYTEEAICDILKSYHDTKEDQMNPEMEKNYADAQAKIAELESQVKTYADEKTALQSKIADSEKARKVQEVNAYLDAKKDSFTPAQREVLFALAMHEGEEKIVHEYKEGDAVKKIEGSPFDLVKSVIENNREVPSMGTETNYSEQVKGEDDQDSLDRKAKKYVLENKVSYKEALLTVGKGEV